MAETNPNLQKYRDLLENIINTTMEHLEQASRLEPASVCPCANCSPPHHGNSNGNGNGNSVDEEDPPPSAFSQLYGTFTRMNFEFPSRSYPEYTTTTNSAVDTTSTTQAEHATTAAGPTGSSQVPSGDHEPNTSSSAAEWPPDTQHFQNIPNFIPRSGAISFARVVGSGGYSHSHAHGQEIDGFLVPDLWDFSGLDNVATGLSGGDEFMQ